MVTRDSISYAAMLHQCVSECENSVYQNFQVRTHAKFTKLNLIESFAHASLLPTKYSRSNGNHCLQLLTSAEYFRRYIWIFVSSLIFCLWDEADHQRMKLGTEAIPAFFYSFILH